MNETKHRGRPKVEIWAYGNDGMCKKFDSIYEAALAMGEHPVTLRKAAIDGRITRKGYLYSFKQLTVNEVDEKFNAREKMIVSYKKNQPNEERANNDCKEIIGNQEFSVNCFDRQITYIPRNRKDKINLLKKFIWAHLQDRWMYLPTKVANIEKRAYQELLDSLQ